ncbi:hypothetical protein AB0M00_19370 [Streptomyces chartreusis]|uniref:hypothetical protein n=1 Tax=Streptomyces chartreusis TaxID=1969 RepID=UPI00342A12E6
MTRLHASLRRGEVPVCDGRTGEIRVPLTVYDLDEPQAYPDLVLSRAEGEALFAQLRAALVPAPEQPATRPEVVR